MESIETARKNFRRLMEFLKGRNDITITTFSDLMARFSYQKETIDKAYLREIAKRILTEKTVSINDHFSPAEFFAALAQSIAEYSQTGSVPKEVKRTSPLGPMDMPIEAPEISRVDNEQVFALARTANAYITDKGSLPPWLEIDDKKIGTGSLLALFITVFLDIYSDKTAEKYDVIAFDPYPKENEEAIISEVRGCKTWPVHRLDLDMSHLVELTKMQLWTLKPALESC